MVLMGRNESTFNAIYHENSCCNLYGLFKPIPIRAFFFSKPLSKKKKQKKKTPDDWEVTCEGSHPRPPGRAGRPDV